MQLGNVGRVGIGWAIFTFIGVSGFVVSKNSIDKKRYESMKVRDRMRKSNDGEYQVQETKRFDV